MRSRIACVSLLALVFCVAVPATAGLVVRHSSVAEFQDMRWYLNGFVEYGLEPSPTLTPVLSSLDPTAEKVAVAFLKANQRLLGIGQAMTDFRHLRTEALADGAELVYLEQTWLGVRIESSLLRVRVVDRRVSQLSARFVSDVGALADCGLDVDRIQDAGQAWAVAHGWESNPVALDDMLYRPYGDQTYLTVLTSMDVSNGQLILIVDACDAAILDGYTQGFEP